MGNLMDTFNQIFLPLMGAAGGGLAAYIAIRSNLAALNTQVAIMQKSLERAHERIDDLQRDRRS